MPILKLYANEEQKKRGSGFIYVKEQNLLRKDFFIKYPDAFFEYEDTKYNTDEMVELPRYRLVGEKAAKAMFGMR